MQPELYRNTLARQSATDSLRSSGPDPPGFFLFYKILVHYPLRIIQTVLFDASALSILASLFCEVITLISQPAVQSTATPMASGSVPDQPTESDGLFAGFLTVAPWRVPILFLRSLHPGYIPPGTQPSAQPDEGPAFTFGSPDGQDSSFFQGVELAARLVSPYTVLPAEIRTMLEGIVTFSAATRFRDLLGAFGATEGSPPTESRADISEDGSPTNDKGRKKKKPQQTRQRTSPPATNSIGTGQLPKTAVALGALSSLSAAAAASSSGSKTEGPIINVTDATILGKIGRDPDYPLNGTYRQTANINGGRLSRSIGNKTHAFTGKYDGQGNTIHGLRRCLVKNLTGEVDDLRFTKADIKTTREKASTGVAACKMSGGAVVSNIHVESASLNTRGNYASAGIAVGEVNQGTVRNTTAVNCNVQTSGPDANAGIGAGYVTHGTVSGTTAEKCEVITSNNAGIGAGRVDEGSVADTSATGCTVKTSGGNAGIGAGREISSSVARSRAFNCKVESAGSFGNAGVGVGSGTAVDTTAMNCNVKSSGSYVSAGIGVGNGGATDTTAMNCTVTANGEGSNAGIGSGDGGTADNTIAKDCTVETYGIEGNAGIGVGGGIAADTTAMNCTVKTYGNSSNIGIGVGKGAAADTLAIGCTVENHGSDGGSAGIGVGMGAAVNTTAINCTVETSGVSSFAGIGAGVFTPPRGTGGTYRAVANTMSFNSTVKNSGASGYAGIGSAFIGNVVNTKAVKSTVESSQTSFPNNIGGGRNPTYCDVRVNDKLQRDTIGDCSYLLDNFCEAVDPPLVKPNCRPSDCYFEALTGDSLAGLELCPVAPEAIPTTGSQVTASAQTSTPEAMTASTHTLTSSSTPPTVTHQMIEVTDVETLGKIGIDPNYPINGNYIQTKDIDARNLSRPISRFTGQYNGQNYTTTIANLGCCLVDTVEGGGTIGNLHFTGANIVSASRPAGVVACGVSGNGTIRDIFVENSQVITTGNDADAGIGAGVLSGEAVVDILAKNSTVVTHGEGADAGIGSGSIGNDAVISHVEALRCRVKTVGNNANAAIGAGYVNGTVASTSAFGSEVTTSGKGSHAAIGGGKVDNGGTVTNTTAFVNGVKTTGDQANAGVGAGAMGRGTVVANTLGQGCEVSTSGDGANAGIGAGRMGCSAMLKNTSAERFSSVTTSGAEANAGIGAGLMDPGARMASTRSVESRVETTGDQANAGIGAGFMDSGAGIAGTRSVRSRVKTTGDRANAGIGAGAMGNGTGIANTLAKNSKVSTSGDGANAGIGAGRMGRSARMENTSAQCFSSVTTSGAEANAGIGAGLMDPRARIVGTRSHNSEVETSGVRAHAGIGAGMIRDNASVTDTRAVNPRATASGNNASANIDAGRIEPGGVVTNTTEVYTGWPGVLACEPVIPATASSTAMSFPGATMTLPTSTAPLATTLSNGAIAGITLGAAVSLVLAGVVGGYIYRHCCRRPSPVDAGDPQELVAVNKAGQAQEAVDQPMMLLEEPGDRGGHQHEHIYEEIDIYNPRRMRTAVAPDY